jgi:type IV secretory pathway VirB2 component (pilin)
MFSIRERVMRIIIFLFLLISNSVFAYSGQSTKIDSVLQALLDYLTSTPARLIAVLAIVGVGYTTLHLGRMPKQRAISIVIGIGIIFGGAYLYEGMDLRVNY